VLGVVEAFLRIRAAALVTSVHVVVVLRVSNASGVGYVRRHEACLGLLSEREEGLINKRMDYM